MQILWEIYLVYVKRKDSDDRILEYFRIYDIKKIHLLNKKLYTETEFLLRDKMLYFIPSGNKIDIRFIRLGLSEQNGKGM